MEIRFYLQMLRRSWWMVALATLVALNVALISALVTTPQYQTSTRFVVSPNAELLTGKDVITSLEALDKRSIVSTYAEFLNSRRIHEETIAALNMTPEAFDEYTVNAVVLPDANIIELTVSGPDPVTTALLANSIGQRTIDYIGLLYRAYDISVLDSAIPPTEPYIPQPARDVSLALVLGLVGGAALAILSEQIRIPIETYRQRLRVDNVTGTFNRRYFQQVVDDALSAQPNDTLSLGIVDLPGLQEVMETIPPASSERLLRKITDILRKELRGNDVIGRWSETSFAVMLPTTGGEAAFRTFERIYQALVQPVQVDQFDLSVLLNPKVGGAVYGSDISAAEFFGRAETAIGQARLDANRPVYIWQMKSPFWMQKA
jgi:diguanylate cyclase (GGDEF)-like protein